MKRPRLAPAASPRPYLLAAIGISLVAATVRVWAALTTHATAEDFLITLRYAENVAAGHGFVYNLGQRVLGTTTPLYTLLLAVVAACRLDAGWAGKLFNIAADSATCYAIARLLALPEIGRPVAGLFAATLYAVSSTPINISIGGMETGLVALTCTAMTYCYMAGSTRPLYVLGAALVLLRIDGLLLFGLLAVGLALRERRVPWDGLAIAAALVAPWVLFALLYFGSPVPTSLVAKLLVYGHGVATSRAAIVAAFRTQFWSGPLQKAVTLLFLLGVIRIGLSLRLRTALGRLMLPIAWVLIYYGTMFTSPVPAFAWYFLPPWPLFVAIAALGAAELIALLPCAIKLSGSRPLALNQAASRFWPALLGLFLLAGMTHTRAVRADIARTQYVEDSLRLPMGLWLRDHAAPNERTLLEPIGYVGYYSQRPILDMIGLVSPEVFPSYHTSRPLGDIVDRLKPEWLALRPAEIAALARQNVKLPSERYTYVRTFAVPGRPPDFYLFHRSDRA